VQYVRRLFRKEYTPHDRDAHALKDKGVYLLVLESAAVGNGGGPVWRRIGLVAIEHSELSDEQQAWGVSWLS
jgi:hypothetical protein